MTAKRFYLTIATIVRNEAAYIAEWIEYHSLIGVEHFYIYDNDSTDELATVLRPYLLDGRVTLLAWPIFPGQIAANNHAIKIFGRDCEWMALIDVDEFIALEKGESLPKAIAELALDADQLLLSWIHFGSSGHEERPEGLVIESYVHRDVAAHRQPKTIVRPAAVRWAAVHHCETLDGRTINAKGETVAENWILKDPVIGPIRLHHYFTKSRAEFAAKIARGQAGGGRGKTLDDFSRFVTDHEDTSLATMGPAVRAALMRTATREMGSEPASFSAQSELTPSRVWVLAVNDAIRTVLSQNAPAIRSVPMMDHMIASGGPISEDCSATFMDHVAGTLHATAICRFSGDAPVEIPIDVIPSQDGLGKPFTGVRVLADQPATLIFRVDGIDAAGKPWCAERQFAVSAGENLLCFIQSPRTMRIARFQLLNDTPAASIAFSGRIYVFR